MKKMQVPVLKYSIALRIKHIKDRVKYKLSPHRYQSSSGQFARKLYCARPPQMFLKIIAPTN